MKYIVLVFICSLLGCSKQMISINLIADFSAKDADLATSGKYAALIAEQTLNKEGSLLGSKVQVNIININDAKFMERYQNSSKLSVGFYTSKHGNLVDKLRKDPNAVLISPTMSAPRFDYLNDSLFRLNPSESGSLDLIVNQMLKRNNRTACIISDSSNPDYADVLSRQLKLMLDEKNMNTCVYSISMEDHQDVKKTLEDVEKIKPEAVMFFASGKDIAYFAKSFAKRGRQYQLYSGNWGQTSELLNYGGVAVEGLLLVGAPPSSHRVEKLTSFTTQYQAYVKQRPSLVAINTYDAIIYLANIIKRVRTLDPNLIKEYIRTNRPMSLKTISAFRFTKSGDRDIKHRLMKVNKGRFELL